MSIRESLALAMILSALSSNAQAENLGRMARIYPIAERSLLEWIHASLQDKERSGELARLQREAQRRAIDAIENPQALPDIATAEIDRTFYWDPTQVLEQNVVDENGQLLYPAGTRINPLEVITLSKHMLFLDARNDKQVARAKALREHYSERLKIILVGGSYRKLTRQWQIPVYYDQGGYLTRRFGIRHVPALVSQEGHRLRIDELASGP